MKIVKFNLFKLAFQKRIKQLKLIKLKPFSLIVLFCLTLITTPVIAQINTTQTEQLIQEGKQLYHSQQFNEAVSKWQKVIEILSNNSLNKGMALSNLSLTYQQLGEWQKAEEAITESLDILQSLKVTPEQQRILAQSLDIKGRLLQKTGQSQLALETWQSAIKIYPNLIDKKNNQINQVQGIQDLGLYPLACQTLLEIIDLKNQECSISEVQLNTIESEILNNPNQNYKIKALRSLGNVLRVIGNFQQSEMVLKSILEISEKENYSQEISKTLLNLGNTERALAIQATEIGDISESEEYQKKALNSYQKVATLSTSLLKIQGQLNQIELLISQKNWVEADNLLSEVATSLVKIPVDRDRIYAQINYAKNWLCLQQKQVNCLNPQTANLSSVNEQSFQKVIDILKETYEFAVNLQDKRTQSHISGLIGRLYESRQNWQLAQQYTNQALYDSGKSQARELTYQWQWQKGRIFKAQSKNQDALKAYQEAVQTLKSLRNDLVSINTEVQFTFRESVEPVYREYVDLLLQIDDNNLNSPENIQLARETIDSLQLAELENFFRLVCLDANPVVIDQVTDKNDPTSAVIYPILLGDRFEIILKLPQEPLRHYSTPINSQIEIERILTQLSKSLNQANSQQTLPLAQLVYNWLIRPVEQDLAQSGIKNLVFVLDSALRNIPMSVLHDGEKYLIEKYSVALIPSLQLLQPEAFKQRQTNALFAGLSQARGKFSALPFVPEEIEKIRSQVSNSRELLDQTFTNELLQNTINSAPFSVVHFATHGQFSSKPEQTFILTWNDRLNVNQLNKLIRSKDSEPIELLVLSACKTLTGDKRASLGLAGVAIRGGARSTLATLWQVNDQTTAILMNQFYSAFKESTITKAEALRQAQLTLLNNPIYKSPHFWSAYVLLGNWL